jgi:adenylate cyclase class 2
MLEIECKLRVPALEPVRERLLMAHGTPLGTLQERDAYFNAPHRDFGTTDEALRIRHLDGRCILTYKGPKKKDYHFKAREEINVDISTGKEFEELLQRLGFFKVAEVVKTRENYRFRDATVSLDNVEGLGTFVEIEAPNRIDLKDPEKLIEDIARELGIEGTPILTSYLELLLATR